MIDPELRDWWTHKHLTNLHYSTKSLGGAGVSVQVLLKAFVANDYFWFSRVYGEYNDDFFLVAIDKLIAEKYSKEEYRMDDFGRNLFGRPLENEYKLTDEIITELGIILSYDEIKICQEDKFCFSIFSHDNCFFHFEPIASDILPNLIHVILEQHSFYMGKEIQWEGIESQLVEIIKDIKEIDIYSDPRKNCLWIPQLEKNTRNKQGTIVITGLNASFREYYPSILGNKES
jgi:hypothetical protein